MKSIPEGRVCTYGGVAALAGSPRAARQVVRILHSLSSKESLPWHRVVNRQGKIAIPDREGFSRQKAFLEAEGVEVDDRGVLDLSRYLWTGGE